MVTLDNLHQLTRYCTMTVASLSLYVGLTTATFAASLPAEDTYAVLGLQSFSTKVNDLNDSGFTTGQAVINIPGDYVFHAVYWDNTGVLTDLDSANINTDSIAYGINNLNDSVGRIFGIGSLRGPALFTQGSIVKLLDQYGAENYYANAFDINDNGLIVGCANDVPVQWNNSVIAELVPGTPIGATGCAITANNRGDIVGSITINGNKRATLWRNGTMIDLGVLPGHESSTAAGINELGQIVGSSTDLDGSNANVTLPFLWDSGLMTDLGTLSGDTGSATDINDQGHIVGNAPGPFLYRDGMMYDLLEVSSLLQDAVAINENRQIAGSSDVLTPAPNQLDMAVSMIASEGPLDPDTVYDYEITVTNRSAVDGNDVILTNTLSDKLEVLSVVSSQGVCTITVPVTCHLGNVGVGSSSIITLTVRPQVPFSLSGYLVYVYNTARAETSNDDVNYTNDFASRSTTIVPPPPPESADLSIHLSDSPDPLPVGNDLIYTSTIVNNGPLTSINTVFNQSINVRFKIRSVSTTHGSCSGRDSIQCDLGDLAPDENATIVVTISPRTRNVDRFFSSANISSDTYDRWTTNNSSAMLTTVQQ